jgi:hypothetical protein
MRQQQPSWQCPNCGELVEAGFEICWNCGTASDGTPTEDFRPEPSDPAVPDLGPDSDEPEATTAELGPAGTRIVELCSAANAIEAEEFRAALAEEGIPARVVGDVLGNSAGGLPLGETTAPRVWVCAEDAARARAIIEQLAKEPDDEEPDDESDAWPQADSPPEWALTTAEPDDALAPGEPLPSDVKFRFLSQGFYIVGALLMAFGAIWAYKNSLLLERYPAQTEGYWTGALGVDYVWPHSPDNMDFFPTTWNRLGHWSHYQSPEYVYFVAGQPYFAYGGGASVSDRVAIRYDPRRPDRYLVGAIMPPWLALALGLGVGAFSMFVGYQFR